MTISKLTYFTESTYFTERLKGSAMFFDKKGFSAERNDSSVLLLMPPITETNGKEESFLPVSANGEQGRAEYEAEDFFAVDSITSLGEGLFRVERRVENRGRYRRVCKLITEVRDLFPARKTLIPCVSFDGNEKSLGAEPHGYSHNGEAWIFASDREGIPAATVTEDKETVCALFASPEGRENQDCACSFLREENGCFRHRIYYPVTEAPLSYTSHDILTPRYDTYLTIEPDSFLTRTFYLFVGDPVYENYGYAALMRRVAKFLPFTHEIPMAPETVYQAGLSFCEYCVTDYRGAKMFRNILLPDPENPDGYCFPYLIFEAGWSGQNFQQARLFIEETLVRGGEQKYLEIGLSCLDAWVKTQSPCGLIETNYLRAANGKTAPADICNLAWAACETFKAYRVLKNAGTEREDYLRFASRLCDFFCRVYNEEDGFGLSYHVADGSKAASGGSIGGFAVMALLEGWKTSENKLWLDTAKRAMDFYYRRDLENFICTAGAIDCTCIDKETAFPFALSALDLFDITGEDQYRVYAEKAGYYFASYLYFYDVACPEGCDFDEYGYFTSGATSVSTQHPALDSWGSIMVPEYIRLWKKTGDSFWLDLARRMWCNACLCINTDTSRRWHGRLRPYGAQSEAYFPSRWAREKYYRNVEKRGSINHLFACWCSAYRMSALGRLTTVCGEKNTDLLR